jgi:hypothetical protein
VKAAIAEGLRLLEAKDFATFLKTFMKPTDLTEHLSKFGTMEKLTAALSRHKESALLLEKFRAASKVEPTFSGDGVRANFPFDAVIGNDRRLQLEKIGDRWSSAFTSRWARRLPAFSGSSPAKAVYSPDSAPRSGWPAGSRSPGSCRACCTTSRLLMLSPSPASSHLSPS